MKFYAGLVSKTALGIPQVIWRMVNGAFLNWRWRWRLRRSYCFLMNRWQGLALKKASA